MIKKQLCTYCNEKFHPKGIKSHLRYCKERKYFVNEKEAVQPVPEVSKQLADSRVAGLEYDNQRFRGRNAIIEFTESVTKLNMAFAQVIGEWRF